MLVAFQAPAVHVVAVGLESGRIILHNLKFDETILELKQDWGPVTTLSFRTGETGSNVTSISCKRAVFIIRKK